MDDFMERVLDRLDELHRGLSAAREGVGELRGWEERTEGNVERFWSQEWPGLKETLDGHERRIHAVEDAVTELHRLPPIIEKLDLEVEGVEKSKFFEVIHNYN